MKNKVDEKESNNTETKFEEIEPTVEEKFEEVEPIKKEVRTDSYFDGSLIELIGWKLLSYLITAVTLGIGSPWGKCMLYSYQIKHTVYNGKRLKFRGTGGDLFVNMFKWFLLSVITFGIYILFIPVRKTKWVISNIHFEDEEYNKDESFFDGKTIALIGINLLCNFLNGISFGLLYSFTFCFKLKWINKHIVINRKKISFNGKSISLFGKYILWCFLTLITFGIYGLWLPIKMLKWQTKHTHIKTIGEAEEKDKSLLIAIPIVVISIIALILIIPTIMNNIKVKTNGENPFKYFIEYIAGDKGEIKLEDFNIFKNIKIPNKSSAGFEGVLNNKGGEIVIPEKIVSESETSTSKNNSKVLENDNVQTNNKATQTRGEYPTAEEIEGTYSIDLIEKYLVNGEYDESKTIEAGGIVTFSNESGRINYNNQYTMDYIESLGYGSCSYNNGNTMLEAYFTYDGDRIKAEMRLYEYDLEKESRITCIK